jgi:hypothetical protein
VNLSNNLPYFSAVGLGENRLLLKKLVTMEVIQWTSLWEFFKEEYENEKNYLGGALGDKAAEDLKLRIIEHVCPNFWCYISLDIVSCWLFIVTSVFPSSEHLGCLQVLFKGYA